ncbi:HK97 family phage prohead protease [Mycolicibacterium sp. PAM1]|uniref:Phage prohead protease, HK97 family n=1 Tax=Mycolicibacterium gilvum (strain PYR-GCK) TaxID=350054 RepID=A4TBM3_MYCGI|nr:HK97 family phage prohead protease [Mycolicibacterium sp. PAM1]ABP45394.1 phage prohead protease, HK97 family [Mycolicibacterium gilvum PYR-GCK]MBV5244340.1 HK97 family phage prohead protease [Mycolicibacterium sp. PAM1]
MQRKSVALSIKSADDQTGVFTGLASVFGNVDAHGDIVRRGAFTKSLAAGQPIPLLWMHKADDPRNYVGDVIEATETAEGLAITGKFDLDTDHGAAAYRNVKGRRVGGLSIGYRINHSTKTAAGNELTDLDLVEISVVDRGANDRALIGAVKSAGRPTAPIRAALARDNVKRYHHTPKDVPPMFENTMQTLTKDRDSQLALVKQIIDTADELGRDLTAEETSQVEEATGKAKSLDSRIAQVEKDMAIYADTKRTADIIGGLDDMARNASGETEGGHLALTGKHAKAMAQRVIKAMPRGPGGTKAFAAGVQTTSTIVLPDVVQTGRPAVSVLDVLPTRVVPPSYSFLRQSARNNNASVVPVGGTKPTTDPQVVGVENRLRVVAHVSTGLDHYLLSDAPNLERFVQDEMLYGLRVKLEQQILAGAGEDISDDDMTGVLNTSGVVVQAFATNALTSVRKAITTLEAAGYKPGLIVLSAADWEAVELLNATSGATDVQGVPVDPVARRLWGVPVVLNQGLGAKTGLVIGDGALTVDHDGQVEVKWSDAVSDDFLKNQVRCRVEGRFGVSVNQPAAVVKVATAAA